MPQTSSSARNFIDIPVRVGQVLEGKLRVERIIGEGAMGLVVEATHLALDERVALKFLRKEARERPDIVSRFAREARSAARIKSDHVARVHDVGGTDDGTPFIVMEFLEGSDLEAVLAKRGKLGVTEVAEIVIQACEGLAAAHAHGIVHRDIKPANLFITEHGGLPRAKILDFGISKAGMGASTFDDIDVNAANTSQIMGSPHYMSPEQIRSTRDVDARADIWSLGVVLFELVSGQTPFNATEVTGIIAQVLHEPHRPLRSFEDVPAGFEEIVEICLRKEASTRYQTAADLAVALLPFAPKRSRAVVERAVAITTRSRGDHQPAPDSLPPPPATPSLTGATTQSNGPSVVQVVQASQPPASSKGLVSIAVVAVLLGLAGGGYAIWARLQGPVPAAQATASPPVAPTTPAIPATTAPAPPSPATAGADATPAALAASVASPAPTVSPAGAPSPAIPAWRAPGPVRTAPARPAASPSADAKPKPPSEDTDIRRER